MYGLTINIHFFFYQIWNF